MQLLTITHNSAPLPTLCLLYFTVPRQGQKFAFRDLKLRKMPFSSTKMRLEPRPPPLTVPLQPGQCERFTETISRFRRLHKGQVHAAQSVCIRQLVIPLLKSFHLLLPDSGHE